MKNTTEKNKLILEYATLASQAERDEKSLTRMQTIAETLKMTDTSIMKHAVTLALANVTK